MSCARDGFDALFMVQANDKENLVTPEDCNIHWMKIPTEGMSDQ